MPDDMAVEQQLQENMIQEKKLAKTAVIARLAGTLLDKLIRLAEKLRVMKKSIHAVMFPGALVQRQVLLPVYHYFIRADAQSLFEITCQVGQYSTQVMVMVSPDMGKMVMGYKIQSKTKVINCLLYPITGLAAG